MSEANPTDQQGGKPSDASDGQIQWVVLEGQPQGLGISMVQPAGESGNPPGTFLIEFTTLDHSEVLFPIWQGVVAMSGFLQLPNTGYPLYPALFAFSNAAIFPGENWFRTMRVRFEGLAPFNVQLFEPDPDKPSLYRLLIAYRS